MKLVGILVLWAISYLAGNLEKKEKVENWLKESALWNKVSENEKLLFSKKQTKRVLVQLSWRIEAVIVLSWCVKLIDKLPALNKELPEDELDGLINKLPIGEDPSKFIAGLNNRDLGKTFFYTREKITNRLMTLRNFFQKQRFKSTHSKSMMILVLMG